MFEYGFNVLVESVGGSSDFVEKALDVLVVEYGLLGASVHGGAH